jgi:hypothetical protein
VELHNLVSNFHNLRPNLIEIQIAGDKAAFLEYGCVHDKAAFKDKAAFMEYGVTDVEPETDAGQGCREFVTIGDEKARRAELAAEETEEAEKARLAEMAEKEAEEAEERRRVEPGKRDGCMGWAGKLQLLHPSYVIRHSVGELVSGLVG